MRMNDNFNIITGAVKTQYPQNHNNRRFSSLNVIKNMRENEVQESKIHANYGKMRRLGTAQDSKIYQYSYYPKSKPQEESQPLKNHHETGGQLRKKHSQPISLINATKLDYNIISNTVDSYSQSNWGRTKKQCPVSKFTDLGRINAPNYSETYKNNPSFSKKQALCSNVCQIQKSYGLDKYFRKFK